MIDYYYILILLRIMLIIKIKEIPFVLIFNTLILDRNQSDLRRP